MSKKRLTTIAVVMLALVIAGIALYKPIAIHYLIWRYKASPDRIDVYLPSLCSLGPDARDPLIRAFEAIGPDEEVHGFRVSALHTLRCLRYDEASAAAGAGSIQQVAYADLPLDRGAVDTMIAAFAREPSAELRDQMLPFTNELDYRTRFAFHVGLLQTTYPIPETYAAPPIVDPYAREDEGLDVTGIRGLWCELVAPAEVDRLLGRGTLPDAVTWYDRMSILEGLLDNDCAVSAPAIAEYVALTDAPTRSQEMELLLEGHEPLHAYREAQLRQLERESASFEAGRAHLSSDTLVHDTVDAVGDDPERAARYLGPLLRQKHSCTLARDLRQAFRDLEIGDDHPLAEAVEVWGVQSVARCGEEFLWSGM